MAVLPGNGEPIVLPPDSPALHLVMRVRDEAHRFAITHHRSKRGKAMTKSVLDTLDGVGPVRKKRLLTAFGSVRAIRARGRRDRRGEGDDGRPGVPGKAALGG